jgi:hypothetical protein
MFYSYWWFGIRRARNPRRRKRSMQRQIRAIRPTV